MPKIFWVIARLSGQAGRHHRARERRRRRDGRQGLFDQGARTGPDQDGRG
ncbi:MAG: hypothetical protein MZU91_06795 [Desulfosudis oleivorans]|nr:hypothetical protein [Desulfosudis oleivorans]